MRRSAIVVSGLAMLAVFAGCAQQGVSGSPSPTPPATTTTSSAPAATTSSAPASTSQTPSPAPTTTSVATKLSQGQIGGQVRELQARLRQLNLLGIYDLTDTYGDLTASAVKTFQEQNGLPVSGDVDEPTWNALLAKTKAPSAQELNNQVPGAVVLGANAGADKIKDLQHRLQQKGVYSAALSGQLDNATVGAIRAFQTNQAIPVTGEVDQRTYDRLVSQTRTPATWELNGGKAPVGQNGGDQQLDPRCLTGRAICASFSQLKVSWVVDGKILATMDARYGRASAPTRAGVFHVWLKDANAKSTAFENVSAMPYSLFFDQERAVHFSYEFVRDGYGGWSHGCINVRDMDTLKWVFSQVNVGDTVVVYN